MTDGAYMSKMPSITDIIFPPLESQSTWTDYVGELEFQSTWPDSVGELEFQPTWPDSVGELEFQRPDSVKDTKFQSTWPDSVGKDSTDLRFNLEDIIVATNNFAEENIIEREIDFLVYEGELSGKKLAFVSVREGVLNTPRLVQFSSSIKQENIVSLDGFCDQDGKLILVFEHPARGRLDKYVSSTHLTWLKRIQICLDVAHGLQYLQSHSDRNDLEVTELINSANIYLYTNWQAKIQFFRPSVLVDFDQAPSGSKFGRQNSSTYKGQLGYADCSYIETGIQSLDLYSFGVLLFELLCGRLAVTEEEKNQRFLSSLAITHYENGTLAEFIDPALRVQMNRDSFTVFSELAYACLCDSPTILEAVEGLEKVLILEEFKTPKFQQVTNIEDLKIPLKEIESATHHSIGTTGKVYKADLSHFNVDKYFAENKIRRVSREEILKYPRRKSTLAIKNIDGGYGEQTEERLQTLLSLSHENLVKLVGFCDEDDECIHVVYEYASKGSLDEYIHRQHTNYQNYIKKRETMRNIFPWVIRLQFCLDAARGLNFLHNGNGKNHSIIHGNIKSSNILIGRDGVGMIGDFGLSTNQNTHTLTEQRDVFSFGLVLFEVLSGKLTDFKITESDLEFLPEIVKLGFDRKNLDDIVDPMLKQEFENDRSSIMDERTHSYSIKMFADIAYRCFKSWKYPTMADIVEELEKAYKYHVESSEKRQENEDNSKMESLKHLKIPFKDIYSATHGFEYASRIGKGGFGGVYTAELFHVDVRKYVGKKESAVELYGYSRRKGKVALKRREIKSGQGREQFLKEIDVLSGLNHQNIISLVGFCYEYGEMIIIYDYASNGSFEKYIRNIQNLKWEQRLQICIDAAQGLNYLHNHHIIHRDVKSPNILLGDSLEGMIGDVGLSITVKDTDSQLLNINVAGTGGYVDPIYLKKGILSKQSDMYSFGVVLLEVLCGRLIRPSVTGKDRGSLVEKAEQHLTSNQPYQIIGDYLRKDPNKEKFLDSIKKFAAITHDCLHSSETHRLTMADILKELKKALAVHLIGVETILLEDVKRSTDNFNDKRVIGSGASGKVYKGELTLFKKSIPVAVKRLDKVHSYGEGAFLKEVVKLSRYVHDNIITLRGFCEEDDEKIIIMDHASNESLDRHLDKSILTWGIRLKICIGAAKGLNYIHSFEEDQETVHGNIKSSNILLDQDWNATISDFIISKTHGTKGYLDPQYSSSGATKASDVYSFGVVLFELLSGRLAIEKAERYSHPTLRQIINVSPFAEQTSQSSYAAKDKKDVFLVWMAACCFEEKKQRELIFDDIKEQTDAKSIDILLEVAYECLQKDQAKRPTMGSVIKELEKALNIHEEWEFAQTLPKDNENIMKMIEHPESQEITMKDLNSIFSSGILLNNGKLLLSLNKDGKAKEMISATTFSYEKCWSSKRKALDKSRFGTVAKISDTSNLKIGIKIKTQFLSLGIIYGAFLVFGFCDPKMVSSKLYVNLKYRTASGKSNSYTVERKDGDWMMIELCRFRNHDQIIDFEVQLKSFCGHPCGNGPIFIDGIEFRPINNVDHEESVDRSINADSSVNWEQQSPSDFQEVMKRSQYDVLAMNKPELDKSTGVLINNGEKLFSQSKVNCQKCHMLPAKAVINKSPDTKFTKCPSSALSRFEEVAELQCNKAFSIKCNIETQMLSPDTAYACNLVFQLPENCKGLNCPVKARDLLNKNNKESTIIYLKAPGPVDLYRDKRVPENREDGWMEVRVWEFVYNNEIKDNYIPMELKLVCLGGTTLGLIICGVEFRPM